MDGHGHTYLRGLANGVATDGRAHRGLADTVVAWNHGVTGVHKQAGTHSLTYFPIRVASTSIPPFPSQKRPQQGWGYRSREPRHSPTSIWQADKQPSPLAMPPSSQVSEPLTNPSPHWMAVDAESERRCLQAPHYSPSGCRACRPWGK